MQELHQTRPDSLTDFVALQLAFQEFSKASATLETSYKELQSEARRLSTELALTNAELEQTLSEKERAQEYLKNILESLSDGVLVTDSSGHIQICNPAATRILGVADVEGSHGLESLTIPKRLKNWMETSLAGESKEEDLELQVEDSGKTRHIIASSSPLATSVSGETGAAFILKDITRLKELELKTQLEQRLQAMGEMAVELAHEIRNPLGSIELFASLLSSELSEARLKGWADQIVTSVKFLNNIVTNMLTFTRPRTERFESIDLAKLIDETFLFLEPVVQQRNVRLEKPAGRGICVEGDHQMLWQMFINLLMNALQAMPERGVISVRLAEAGESARIEIEDTGIGIPAENLVRIFDPFFTTNEKGTGLGLSLVYQIVEKHSGRIEAFSEFGKGTRFTVCLPLQSKGLLCRQQTS